MVPLRANRRALSNRTSFQGFESSLVIDTIHRFASQLDSAGCTINEKIEPGILARVDAFRFEQVLTNFITNTIKYAPGRPVEFALTQAPTEITFSIRDHGPGIAGTDLDRVFNRFERLVPATHVSGLGLGLHISKEIVEAHHGKIRAEAEADGGAKFVVTLPRPDLGTGAAQATQDA